MSCVISAIAPLLVAGERERQLREERVDERTVDVVADARLLGRERALARDEPDLHAQELVEHRAAASRRACSAIESGRWIARIARVAVDEVVAIEQRARRAGRRSRAPRHFASASRHERAQLPGEHLGLARLRIHGHDHAGLLVGDAGAAEHVDDRVRHLPLAAVHVELAEERRLGADRAAASRATPG